MGTDVSPHHEEKRRKNSHILMWDIWKWKWLSCVWLFVTPWTRPWNSPGQNARVGNRPFLQGIFPTQRSNPGLLRCRWFLCQLSHKGSPRILECLAYPFSSGFSRPGNRARVSFIAGGYFTNWVIREPYNRILFSHKKNEVLIHVTTWINLENIMQSERRQT